MSKNKKRNRLVVERLEQRQLLTANTWFEDSRQHLGANTDGAELGDLDGDGDLDIFAGCRNWFTGPTCTKSQVWLNDGSGRFSAGWSGGSPSVADIALGDLDNDGDLDAYIGKVIPFTAEPSQVWFNDGQGNFTDSGQRLDEWAIDIDLGDVDGDGDLDAVTASIVLASKVWLNDGKGTFVDSQNLPEWAMSVALGDVDGDGDLDAWLGRGTDSPDVIDRVYLNDGHGKFTDSGQTLNTVATDNVRMGDLDSDGDLDAFLANGNGRGDSIPDRVWFNDGTGKFTDSGQRLGRTIGNSVALGDLDGDGDLDAVVANGVNDSSFLGTVRNQPNEVWLNDGTGFFTASGQEFGNGVTFTVRLGDFDKDGDLDAFFGNHHEDNQVWFNTQVVPFQGTMQAVETYDVQFPTLFVDASGSGNATHLGRFTVTFEFEVDLPTGAASGSAHFIADNGDSLFADFTGHGNPTENPDVSSIVETYTITGGTVRFAGATGSFTLERLLNTVTGVSSGSFDGTIVIPNAGDANRDGVFNSSDLIVVFQAGEYEDGIAGNSTFEEGDWNGDGEFDTSDLILAFQDGMYSPAAVAESVLETVAPQCESLVVKRRGILCDIPDGSLNANAIDQAFEQVLR